MQDKKDFVNGLVVNIFTVHNQSVHNENLKAEKKKAIPVSQSQLAAFLGIKPSAFSMANSGNYNRKLPSAAAEKLAYLYMDFELMEFEPKQPGISSVKMKDMANSALREDYKSLLSEAKYFKQRERELTKEFNEMCNLSRLNTRWLHVLDNRLAGSPTENERIWLEHQQVCTIEKIKKNGKQAQFKLLLDIELTRGKVAAYRNIVKKIAASRNSNDIAFSAEHSTIKN